MKSKNTFLALAATAALALSACAPAAVPTPTPQPVPDPVVGKTVCFVTAAAAHPYVTPFNEELQKVADAAGVEVVTLSAEFDVMRGADQLRTCVGMAPDGIILWPLDPMAYIPAMRSAAAANIPLIIVNTPMDPAAEQYYLSFTGPDVYEQGVIVADMMNAAMDGEGNIVIVAGMAGNATTIGRYEGFKDQLAKLGSKIEVLATVNADFDQKKALVAMRDLITRFGHDIDGVYAQDDIMARGVIDALKEAGTPEAEWPLIIGVGGFKIGFDAIRADEMYGTVLQSAREDGKLAMQTMIDILAGETVEKRRPLPLFQITKENVDQFTPDM